MKKVLEDLQAATGKKPKGRIMTRDEELLVKHKDWKTDPPKLYVFGRKVKRLREARGWTQKELAERAGLRQSAISYYESAARDDPAASSVIGLAKAFGVSTDELLGVSA